MYLFNFGNYKLSSGRRSSFKIDCDALSDYDIDAIARQATKAWSLPYKRVVSIPKGGDRLANAFSKYLELYPESNELPVLIVDDVLTTGNSMEKMKEKLEKKGETAEGFVIFSRTSAFEPWISAMFVVDSCI